ncbi:hypothetical protein FOXYSP1_07109 [Fusarium oxysporum f. sp. phaseoli]
MRARNVSHYTIPDRSDASLMGVALGPPNRYARTVCQPTRGLLP